MRGCAWKEWEEGEKRGAKVGEPGEERRGEQRVCKRREGGLFNRWTSERERMSEESLLVHISWEKIS